MQQRNFESNFERNESDDEKKIFLRSEIDKDIKRYKSEIEEIAKSKKEQFDKSQQQIDRMRVKQDKYIKELEKAKDKENILENTLQNEKIEKNRILMENEDLKKSIEEGNKERKDMKEILIRMERDSRKTKKLEDCKKSIKKSVNHFVLIMFTGFISIVLPLLASTTSFLNLIGFSNLEIVKVALYIISGLVGVSWVTYGVMLDENEKVKFRNAYKYVFKKKEYKIQLESQINKELAESNDI